jgi:hypothetical protein
MKELLALCGVIVLLVLIVVCGPCIHEHFGKRYANADREIHQKSLSYVRGAVEHIQRLKLEYDKAENEQHKDSIKQMVLLQASTVELNQFPPHLQSWIVELRRQ